MTKFLSLLALLGVFIYLFCYQFLNSLLIEAAYLGAIMLYIAIRRGPHALWREVRVFVPIVCMMIAIYVLFAAISIESHLGLTTAQSQSSWEYWINYGGVRTILFLSSILTIGELFRHITVHDILALPLGITLQKSIILGTVLFQKATTAIESADFTLRQFPSERVESPSIWHKAKRTFKRNITLMLGLVIFLSRESTIRGELIDNRIQHCFTQKGQKDE